jgi:1,4-dihydroxy-2-naphthoyl-CoA hydrolase
MTEEIWFKKNLTLRECLPFFDKNMSKHLGIEFTELGPDFLKATMPVDERTAQPMGMLHGGASCVLIETLGSIASNLVVDQEKSYGVGLSINVNHVRGVGMGEVVSCKVLPIHLGRQTHLWKGRVFCGKNLLCESTLTVFIKNKR